MEKFSKWRDPATGIQPFLPPLPSASISPAILAVLSPLSAVNVVLRGALIAMVAALHLLLEIIFTVLKPVPFLHQTVQSAYTAVTCRLALLFMGYLWIEMEMASPKRGAKGVTQISNRSPRRGDLIISNWSSYVDVLYLAFRHNPTFLLPVFSAMPDAPTEAPKFGRQTGTGSASIQTNQSLPQPPLLGYVPVPLLQLLSRTGSAPEQVNVPLKGMYKTLKDARRREKRPVVLFPEGTTGNGRAVLRFGEGSLAEGDVGGDQDGIVWVKYLRHPAPAPFAHTATCSLPRPIHHLLTTLLWTPNLLTSRSLLVRTLNPAASPSSPSFLPSEILASTPGGMEAAGRDGAWREACSIVLAETGKIRRVRLGWVEKKGFLEYYNSRR